MCGFLQILAVALAVSYASGPIHGQASDLTTKSSEKPQSQTDGTQRPSGSPQNSTSSPADSSPALIPVPKHQSSPNTLSDNSEGKKAQERDQSISIVKAPVVSVVTLRQDNYDWAAYWGNFVLIGVGTIGVTAAICTLIAIRNQAIEMRRQRIEMRRMAGLTKRQIALAREEFTTTSRAFVFIDDFDTVLHTRETAEGPGTYDFENGQKLDNFLCPGYFSMQPRWKNSGTTETKDMKISARCGFFDGDPNPDFIGYEESPRQLFVGGNAVQLSRKVECAIGAAMQVVMLANGTPLKGGFSNPILLIWGRADYWDIFCKGHSVEWCYQIGFTLTKAKELIATFTQYGEHNRAYENQKTRPGRDDP
jgi:hypothetical protein